MKDHWEKILIQFDCVDEKVQEFSEKSGLGALQLKKLQKVACEWNKLKKMVETMDQFIAPLDPIKVESPFDQEDFRYIWRTWKEYQQEQHGRMMRSRMEQQSLHYLAEISNNDPDLAISYLRFAMANGYKGFFRVEANDKLNPPKPDKDGSNW